MRATDSMRLQAAMQAARNMAYHIPGDAQSMLAEIMIIWASSYLEATCREVFKNFTDQRAHPAVRRYVAHNLDRFRTPNVTNVINLVRSFDKDLGRELDNFADEDMRESINFVVTKRNQLAHGRLVSASVAVVEKQFNDIKKFSDKLKSLFE